MSNTKDSIKYHGPGGIKEMVSRTKADKDNKKLLEKRDSFIKRLLFK